MNILTIALAEIKHTVRDVRALLFMLAFPIVMMLILGTALSSAFDKNIKVGSIHVLYSEKEAGSFSSPFQNFVKEAKKQDIHFTEASMGMDGKRAVQQNQYDAYIEITGKGIQFYGSERNSIQASIVEGMVTAFTDKFNLITTAAKAFPGETQTVMAASAAPQDDLIKETSLNADKAPGSMDYYAVALTAMIALYSAISGSLLIQGERVRNTAARLAAAPIHKYEIFLGKVLGGVALNYVCILLVMAFSRFVFGADWGSHTGLVILVLLTEVFLGVSFGLALSYLTKTDQGTRSIIMIAIQLASFFGGAYFKIDHAAGILQFLVDISPLTWSRDPLMKMIYNNDITAALPAISLNLGFAVIFLLIAALSLRKREGL